MRGRKGSGAPALGTRAASRRPSAKKGMPKKEASDLLRGLAGYENRSHGSPVPARLKTHIRHFVAACRAARPMVADHNSTQISQRYAP